jgi:hypothetical protein
MAAITRIHGVWVHPRKPIPNRKRCVTLKFVLTGSIPAKKNNQVTVQSFQAADAFAEQCFQENHKAGLGYVMTPAQLFGYKNDKGEKVPGYKDLVSSYIVPSGRHQKWHAKAKEAISAQMAAQLPIIQKRGLIYPLTNVSFTVYHEWKDLIIRDLGNRWESLADLFVDAQLIMDDSDRVINPITIGSGVYKDEITQHTTVINLTSYY